MYNNINTKSENITESPELSSCTSTEDVSTFYLVATTLEHLELVMYYNIFSFKTPIFTVLAIRYQFIASIPFSIS